MRRKVYQTLFWISFLFLGLFVCELSAASETHSSRTPGRNSTRKTTRASIVSTKRPLRKKPPMTTPKPFRYSVTLALAAVSTIQKRKNNQTSTTTTTIKPRNKMKSPITATRVTTKRATTRTSTKRATTRTSTKRATTKGVTTRATTKKTTTTNPPTSTIITTRRPITTTLSPSEIMDRLYAQHGGGSSSMHKIYSQHSSSSSSSDKKHSQHGGSSSSSMDKIYSAHGGGGSSDMDRIYAQHAASLAMASSNNNNKKKKPESSSSSMDDIYNKHSSSSSNSHSSSGGHTNMHSIYQQHSALPSSMYSIMAQHSVKPSKTHSKAPEKSASSSSSITSLMQPLLKQLTPVGAGISVILAPLLLLNGFFTFFSSMSKFLNNFVSTVHPIRRPTGQNAHGPAQPFPPAVLMRQPRRHLQKLPDSEEIEAIIELITKALEGFEN